LCVIPEKAKSSIFGDLAMSHIAQFQTVSLKYHWPLYVQR